MNENATYCLVGTTLIDTILQVHVPQVGIPQAQALIITIVLHVVFIVDVDRGTSQVARLQLRQANPEINQLDFLVHGMLLLPDHLDVKLLQPGLMLEISLSVGMLRCIFLLLKISKLYFATAWQVFKYSVLLPCNVLLASRLSSICSNLLLPADGV